MSTKTKIAQAEVGLVTAVLGSSAALLTSRGRGLCAVSDLVTSRIRLYKSSEGRREEVVVLYF